MIFSRRSLLLGAAALTAGCSKKPQEPPNIYRLPSGLRFGMIGAEPGKPKPLVFRFLSSADSSIAAWDEPNYGDILSKRGFVIASLDVPCHGEDQRKGELQGLSGWRQRADEGEPLMAPWVKRFKSVLDHLVDQKIASTGHIAVTGISRGAFCAFHAAVADPRVRVIAVTAPVCDLSSIAEFAGYRSDPDPIDTGPLADRHILVMVHEDDIRVGTEPARALVERIKSAGGDATLDLVPGKGHGIKGREDAIANWVELRLSATS